MAKIWLNTLYFLFVGCRFINASVKHLVRFQMRYERCNTYRGEVIVLTNPLRETEITVITSCSSTNDHSAALRSETLIYVHYNQSFEFDHRTKPYSDLYSIWLHNSAFAVIIMITVTIKFWSFWFCENSKVHATIITIITLRTNIVGIRTALLQSWLKLTPTYYTSV